MSKEKEYITIEELTDMLSEFKKEQMELIHNKPDLFPNIRINAKFEGQLELFMYMFHFLGLGTEKELHETKERIIKEIMEETRKVKLCQI